LLTPANTTEKTASLLLEERVLREQVATLYASVRTGSLVQLGITTIFWIVFYIQLRNNAILVWAAIHFVQSVRVLISLGQAYSRAPDAASQSRLWERRHSREVFISGCIWGMAPWVFLPANNMALAAVLTLFILGKFTMGMISMVVSKRAVTNYVVPMALGLSSALVWRGDAMHVFLGCASVAYAASMLVFSRRLHQMLTDALVVRFEREALAEQLSEQVAITQRASNDKTRFFAAASHDLRQPLHAIALFGAVLDKELTGRAEHTHAARLMDAVHALSVSLDTMLDVSQLDAGVIKPEKRPVPLSATLEALNQMFAVRANQKGLELRVRASRLWVHTDPQLLQRMLSNLIENALKFTTQGGVIVTARVRKEVVWLDVRDSGMGIAADNIDSIFDEFYQVGNAGRDRTQGLGIGLALVRRLSRLLGHPVQVSSRVGKGSRFRVILPMAPEPSAPGRLRSTKPQDPWVPQKLPRRVLVIDDEADICEAIAALLGLHGVTVVAVSNEADARLALQRAIQASLPFDALLCDYRLQGGIDGLEASLRLRRSFAPQLPLLIITGETAPARLQRIYDLGVPVLFKPAEASELLQALSKLQTT
jgi:signal transduction histidine kinase